SRSRSGGELARTHAAREPVARPSADADRWRRRSPRLVGDRTTLGERRRSGLSVRFTREWRPSLRAEPIAGDAPRFNMPLGSAAPPARSATKPLMLSTHFFLGRPNERCADGRLPRFGQRALATS